jgi:hypothetical protein
LERQEREQVKLLPQKKFEEGKKVKKRGRSA